MQVDDKYKKVFSKNLNYYMNLRGKTQTDIIDDLEINKSAISSWCLGTRLPRMNKVEMLAKYLNINVSDKNIVFVKLFKYNYFEFISEDDAMFPLLDIGDIALIYKQNEIDNILTPNKGTYLIKLSGKNTIRKIELSGDKSFYTLTAMNAYYKIINIPKDKLYNEIQVIGKVVKAENQSAFK